MVCVSSEDFAAGAFPDREEERRHPSTRPQSEHDALAALPDEIWFTDKNGRVTLLSPAAQDMSGVVNGEQIEAVAARFDVYRADGTLRPPTEAPPLRALRGEVIRNEEEVVRCPVTGELRHRLVTGMPVLDGNGETIGSVCVVRDLTERKLAQQALRESEQRFQLALHNTPVSVAILDRDLRYVWAYNQQSARPDEILGRVDEEIFSPGEAAKLDALKRRVLDESVEVRDQTWLDRPEGRAFLDVTYQPIIDRCGEVSGIGMTTVDLTQMKLAEEEVRRSREDMRRAQSVGQIGSWRLDTRENVLTWSDEAYRIFGLPVGTPLTYQTFLARVHPDDRDFVDERWQAALRSEPYDIEHRLLVDGQLKWVREKAFLEYDEAGEPLGGFGITQDVTQRRRAEETLREREAEKAGREERSRLARDLHDSVTQALFAVTMKTEAVALDDELPLRLKRAVYDIERLSRGVLAQMRTLLLELRDEPIEEVPIRQLLHHLVEAAAGQTSTRIKLDVSGDDLLPPTLHVAVYRIAQEALNNMARHAKAEHASVVLSNQNGRVRLSIKDDGCGFDGVPDCAGHLGIAGMHERAKEAGGHLRIVSSPGEGTLVLLFARTGA